MQRPSTPPASLLLLLLLSLLLLLVPPTTTTTAAAASASTAEEEEEDLYDVLGLRDREDASERDIRAAWRSLSKRHHPDLAGEAQRAAFQRIQRAYEILGDRRKRKVYDVLGLDGVRGLEQPQEAQPPHPLLALFGGGGRRGGVERGGDADFLLLVPLADAYAGAAHTVRLAKRKVCRACRGTGARSKDHLVRCTHCRGEGRILRRVQLAPGFVQQMEQPCNHCGGAGVVVTAKCQACQGKRTVHTVSSISIDIERGTPDGHVLTFEMEADQQPNQVPGDVIFTVMTAPNPQFSRSDNDLRTTVVLSLREALLGFNRTLQHLDGHTVELGELGVTQHGEQRRIAGEGMPKHHVPSERGDLYVNYEVELPRLLTAAQREAVGRALSEQ